MRLRLPVHPAAAIVAAVVALAAGAALAQTAGNAEWDRLVAAAKKEGGIAVGGPQQPTARTYIVPRWAKDFPEIPMQFTGAGGADWAHRVKAERSNGKFEWDVRVSGPSDQIFAFATDGVFLPITPAIVLPDLKDPKTWRRPWDEMFLDSGKRMLGVGASPTTVWYNAKTVDPAKVAKAGLGVLLDPAYKGRIAWQDPRLTGPGINLAVLIHEVLGKDGLKRVIVDQDSVFYNRAVQATEALFRGKADFVVAMALDVVPTYAKAGMVFDVRPVGTDAKTAYLAAGGSALTLFDRAPHPNAARLFVNWILTKEIQEGLSQATKWDAVRADVAPVSSGGLRLVASEKYIEVQSQAMLARKVAVWEFVRALRPN